MKLSSVQQYAIGHLKAFFLPRNIFGLKGRLASLIGSVLRGHGADITDRSLRDWISYRWSQSSAPLVNVIQLVRELGVTVEALKIEDSEASFDEDVDFPVIAYLDDGSTVVVHGATRESVDVEYSRFDRRHVAASNFYAAWSGLYIQTGNAAIASERVLDEARAEEWLAILVKPLLIILAGLISLYLVSYGAFQSTNATFLYWLLMCADLVGLSVSILLMQYYLSDAESFLQKFCDPAQGGGCGAVLSSKGSRVFGVPLADIGAVYFGTLALLTAVFGTANPVALIMMLVAPLVSIFSIYYQSRVVGEWCKLCLWISAIIWVQFFSILALVDVSDVLVQIGRHDLRSKFFWLFVTALPSTGWALFRYVIDTTRYQVERASGHAHFVHAIQGLEDIVGRRPIDIPPLSGDIVLGADATSEKVFLLLSPSCMHCADAFTDIYCILKNMDEEVTFCVRLYCIQPETDNEVIHSHYVKSTEAARIIMSTNKRFGPKPALEALQEWFKTFELDSLDTWKRNCSDGGAELSYSNFGTEIKQIEKWCEANYQYATPQMFLNGTTVSELYRGSEATLLRRYFFSQAL